MAARLNVALWFISWLAPISSAPVFSPSSSPSTPSIPLIRTGPSSSLYDSGVSHGAQAKFLIQSWFNTSVEFASVVAYVQTGSGKAAFEQLKHDNAAAFPQYADNLRGIARGAEVDVDLVWVMNLLQELENLMENGRVEGMDMDNLTPIPPQRRSDHCSDLFAQLEGQALEGHNEDWSQEVRPFVYFLAEEPEDEVFVPCAGFAYPAMFPGSALSFNDKGIVYTQNALFPVASRSKS